MNFVTIIVLLIALTMFLFMAAYLSRQRDRDSSSASAEGKKDGRDSGISPKDTKVKTLHGDTKGSVIVGEDLKISSKKDRYGSGLSPNLETVPLFEPRIPETGWRCLYCEAQNQMKDTRCQVCGRQKNE